MLICNLNLSKNVAQWMVRQFFIKLFSLDYKAYIRSLCQLDPIFCQHQYSSKIKFWFTASNSLICTIKHSLYLTFCCIFVWFCKVHVWKFCTCCSFWMIHFLAKLQMSILILVKSEGSMVDDSNSTLFYRYCSKMTCRHIFPCISKAPFWRLG